MKLLFTGDILIYDSQDRGCLAKDGSRDYKPIFAQVKPLLDEADYVVGSFETTLAGEDAVYTHAAYSFNTPDEFLCIDVIGFNGFKKFVAKGIIANCADEIRFVEIGVFSSVPRINQSLWAFPPSFNALFSKSRPRFLPNGRIL